jgi:predicted nucleic acid-binding protein
MWLVDSSRIIDWMRRGRSPVRILRPFVLAGQTVTCSIVRVEVLRGIVNSAAHAEMTSLFDAIPEEPVDTEIGRQASALAWTLDRKGRVLPVSDLIIACCALRARARLVTLDPHFESVPGLRIVKELPDLLFDAPAPSP